LKTPRGVGLKEMLRGQLEPDWFVADANLIQLKEDPGLVPEVEMYRMGFYRVFHSHPRGHLKEVIEPAKFKKWKFRE